MQTVTTQRPVLLGVTTTTARAAGLLAGPSAAAAAVTQTSAPSTVDNAAPTVHHADDVIDTGVDLDDAAGTSNAVRVAIRWYHPPSAPQHSGAA